MFSDTSDDDQKPRDHGPPFDDSDADVLLRSSDKVDFRVYKVILAKSSPFFHDMFSIPQPADETALESGNAEATCRLPVIDVSESSRVLAMLLSMCYPLADEPTFASLQELCSVLAAAKKYDMDRAYKTASRALAQSSFLTDRPARAYAIVCRMELEPAETLSAARACLRKTMSLESMGEDIAFMDGPALHKLWQYHRRCGDVASRLATNFSWVTRKNGEIWAWAPPARCCGATTIVVDNNEMWQARNWWTSYMARAAVALKDRPCGDTVKSPEFLSPSYHELPCRDCNPIIAESLLAFSQVFAQEVERQVDLVALDHRVPSLNLKGGSRGKGKGSA